ncbi:docking protein 2 isoform X2 [Silurus meridionalis]|uniref:docking protein 2 isoform X2 n=1 Tax=Silurus meridionalis TaxID=175797 RepID=UPI001EECCD71|nr:docking protein 2 isoform X2 [Silurus meridionalis]
MRAETHINLFGHRSVRRTSVPLRFQRETNSTMDVIVKEGSVFLQGVKFGKIWRKIWVTVFRPSQVGIGRIEMCDIREGAGVSAKLGALKKAEKRVIRLAECLSVTPALAESCPADCAAFYLNTAQRTYTLAAPVEEDWVSIICSLAFQCNQECGQTKNAQGDGGDKRWTVDATMTENDIYSSLCPGQFQVTVASSEASVRCCMSGTYLLSPEKEALSLLNMKTGHVAFSWPYRLLRRFGLVKEGITIEAGRRCQTGEGHFIFLSKQGPQIYQAIEEAIMHQSVQDLLSKATALPQENTIQRPVQAASPASPKTVISRRNLALPAIPGIKPPPRSPQPECGQAVYATVKPLPKPRNVPPPSILPLPRPMTAVVREIKPVGLDISDNKPHYDSSDSNQRTQSNLDTSGSPLYSSIKHGDRKKPARDTSQGHLKNNQQNSAFCYTAVPVNFKQILSEVLLKEPNRPGPSPTPKSYEASPDLLAEPDYYEIKK